MAIFKADHPNKLMLVEPLFIQGEMILLIDRIKVPIMMRHMMQKLKLLYNKKRKIPNKNNSQGRKGRNRKKQEDKTNPRAPNRHLQITKKTK